MHWAHHQSIGLINERSLHDSALAPHSLHLYVFLGVLVGLETVTISTMSTKHSHMLKDYLLTLASHQTPCGSAAGKSSFCIPF